MDPREEAAEPEFETVDKLTVRDALRGRLPSRYEDFWQGPFRHELDKVLVPGVRILDVGSGAEPTIQPGERPEGCEYVGLDISRHELDRAAPGSYDETVVADLTQRVPELEGRFDVVLSFQVLEHVAPLDAAVENMRAYLKPGGAMLARLSGGRSVSALLNRAVPFKVAVWLETKLRGRDPESIFPARYDRCTDSGLSGMLASWSGRTIVPQYTGALYFRFLRPLQALYLAFEQWVVRRDRRDLAVYYVVHATR
jgi:SAM-dependent methyltransferase